MKIREAKHNDKNIVLGFCKNTFSWGDYIKDAWDFWIKEGYLFVAEDVNPVGICHAFFSNDQIWIEGIRIEPLSRRKGLASKLVSHIESIAIKKEKLYAYMLIDTENRSSLSMAKSLNYIIEETWKFYSLVPKTSKRNYVKFGIPSTNLFSHYVKSWRWLKLDQSILASLDDTHMIFYSGIDQNLSFAISTDSEHFEKTLIVTLHSGSEQNTLNLLSYVENFAFENNYQRIQILTKETLPVFETLEHRISFHLMKKILS